MGLYSRKNPTGAEPPKDKCLPDTPKIRKMKIPLLAIATIIAFLVIISIHESDQTKTKRSKFGYLLKRAKSAIKTKNLIATKVGLLTNRKYPRQPIKQKTLSMSGLLKKQISKKKTVKQSPNKKQVFKFCTSNRGKLEGDKKTKAHIT